MTEEQWLQVIDANLNGVFRITQAIAKEMVKQKSGKIINITSGQGLLGISLMAHYTATKGALIALTRELASELSPLGINVNAIACGLTETEMAVNAMGGEQAFNKFGDIVALRRNAKPEEYIGIAVLLASEEGSFITGETVVVDGGLTNVMVVPKM